MTGNTRNRPCPHNDIKRVARDAQCPPVQTLMDPAVPAAETLQATRSYFGFHWVVNITMTITVERRISDNPCALSHIFFYR